MPAGCGVVVTIGVALLTGAAAPATQARVAPGEIRCDYQQKIECTPGGCQPGSPGAAYLLLPDAAALLAATAKATGAATLPAIKVCDAGGCAPMTVRAAKSGAFVNVAQDGGAHFLKVATADVPPGVRKGDFIEVASRGLATVTYAGRCEALVR